jgi:cell division protein FtsN
MAGRDEDAPWLAEAQPLQAPAPRRGWLNIAIAVLALGAVAAVALLMLLGRKDNGSTQGYMEAAQAPLIEADAGPWKVPPEDRQGMAVEGDGEVIHEAVRGQDLASVIDMNAVPEEPVGRPRDLLPPEAGAAPLAAPAPVPAGQPVPVQLLPPAGTKPVPAAVPAPPKVTPPKPAPAAAARPPVPAAAPPVATKLPPNAPITVQIGAFSSADKADEEWARVAGKAGLTGKQVQKLTNAAGKTLWRVRGQTSDADAACKAILAARGACEVVRK